MSRHPWPRHMTRPGLHSKASTRLSATQHGCDELKHTHKSHRTAFVRQGRTNCCSADASLATSGWRFMNQPASIMPDTGAGVTVANKSATKSRLTTTVCPPELTPDPDQTKTRSCSKASSTTHQHCSPQLQRQTQSRCQGRQGRTPMPSKLTCHGKPTCFQRQQPGRQRTRRCCSMGPS